jgi:hypothetical protein
MARREIVSTAHAWGRTFVRRSASRGYAFAVVVAGLRPETTSADTRNAFLVGPSRLDVPLVATWSSKSDRAHAEMVRLGRYYRVVRVVGTSVATRELGEKKPMPPVTYAKHKLARVGRWAAESIVYNAQPGRQGAYGDTWTANEAYNVARRQASRGLLVLGRDPEDGVVTGARAPYTTV